MNTSYTVHGPAENTKWDTMSLGELLYNSLRRKCQSDILLVEETTGDEISRGQLLENITKFAVILQQMNISDNDTVGIITSNTWKFIVPAMATIFVGATVAPINPYSSKDGLHHYLNLSKPKVLIVSQKVLGIIKELQSQLSFIEHLIVLDGENAQDDLTFDELLSRDVNCGQFLIRKEVSTRAFVLYSSGTTGFLKAVVLSQDNIFNAMKYCCDPEYMDINDESVALSSVPSFHIFGLLVLFAALVNGKKIVTSQKSHPKSSLEAIQKYKVTCLTTIPSLLLYLAESPLVDNYDTSSITHIFCSDAPLEEEVENIASQKFKIPIRQLYGLTECGAITITPSSQCKPGSVGKVVPGHVVKIVDPSTGKTVSPGTTGEICFKGPCVMKEYKDNEEETSKAFDAEGYLHSGDIGYFDEDGYLFMLQRIKDLIKYKGVQVQPAQLEDILKKHPSIKDAAVVGKPDERAGELPTAFIALTSSARINQQEIIDYVAGKVSIEKQLHGGVIFINEIPRSSSGKVLKELLVKFLYLLEYKHTGAGTSGLYML